MSGVVPPVNSSNYKSSYKLLIMVKELPPIMKQNKIKINKKYIAFSLSICLDSIYRYVCRIIVCTSSNEILYLNVKYINYSASSKDRDVISIESRTHSERYVLLNREDLLTLKKL